MRTSEVQYRRLPGTKKWGIRGPTSKVKIGADVEVTLKDGGTERVTVKAIVKVEGDYTWAVVNRPDWVRVAR